VKPPVVRATVFCPPSVENTLVLACIPCGSVRYI
jgi:hypothetical protein